MSHGRRGEVRQSYLLYQAYCCQPAEPPCCHPSQMHCQHPASWKVQGGHHLQAIGQKHQQPDAWLPVAAQLASRGLQRGAQQPAALLLLPALGKLPREQAQPQPANNGQVMIHTQPHAARLQSATTLNKQVFQRSVVPSRISSCRERTPAQSLAEGHSYQRGA